MQKLEGSSVKCNNLPLTVATVNRKHAEDWREVQATTFLAVHIHTYF